MTRSEKIQSVYTYEGDSRRIARGLGIAALAGVTLLGGLVTGCTSKNAEGPCTVLGPDLNIKGYAWNRDNASPINGPYLLFTRHDVDNLMAGNEGDLDHLPQGDEVKVFTNPHDGGNDSLNTSVQDIYSYSAALNSISRENTNAIPSGAVGFQFLKGNCGLNIPL